MEELGGGGGGGIEEGEVAPKSGEGSGGLGGEGLPLPGFDGASSPAR